MKRRVTLLTLLLAACYEARDDIISHLTRETCMGELGCFNAGAPFFDLVERPISLLPEERKSINTKFQLYTPYSPHQPYNLSNLDKSIGHLMDTKFNPFANTTFVIPGYISRTAPLWKMPIVDALLTAFGGNVFMVDWSDGDGPLYEQAVANTRVVGAEIALFIQKLEKVAGIQPESVHLIGHSLGSHIAGYAGKRLKNLGRITAMDPAGPYFTNVDPVVRLDRRDALFVDAIHTNAAPSRFQGFGLVESIAHLDFYPNGGHLQPGCKDMGQAIWSFLKHPSFDAEGLADFQCNHKRAILLFISSITSKCDLMGILCDSYENFSAGKCGSCEPHKVSPSCVPLGMHSDQYPASLNNTRSLNFYLKTTDSSPYCVY